MHGMTSARDPAGRSASTRRNRLLLTGFAVLAFVGVLLPGIFNYLLAGDRRVLVVTLEQGVTDADRETLRRECGGLPGISIVPDQGAREKQYRFPVRFRISDSTPEQEAALNGCIDRFPELVRGALTERER